MNRTRVLLKRLRTPVTILMVPHGRSRPIGIRVPALALLACLCLVPAGAFFVASVSIRALEYRRMEAEVSYLSAQFNEMKDVMRYLREAERDLRKMLGKKSKGDILESEGSADAGSFDMKALREQLDGSMRSVAEIRKYVKEQKDIYRATPAGWPLPGPISSQYGFRRHPVYDERRLHTGVDISAPPGTDVKATADGVVSFAGWTKDSGYVVVVEHGHGFRTAYAHNSKTLVRVGQRVARGETLALSGSTGVSTGPHLHYEVWKKGQHVDPVDFLGKG